jgi:hypothetical protein
MAITMCSNDGFVGESVESAMSQVVCSDDGKGGEEVGVEMEYSETTNAQSCDRRPPTTTTISSIVDSSSYATSLHQRGRGFLRSICRESTKKLVSVVTRSRSNKQRTWQTPKVVVRCEEEVHDQIATPSFTMDYDTQEEEHGRDEEVEIGQEVDHQQTPNNNNNRNVDNEEEEMVVVPSSDASIISSIVTTPNNHSEDNKKQFWNDPVVDRVRSPSSVSIISSIATITPNNASEEKEQVFWNDPVLARERSPSTLTNGSGFSGTTRALLHAPSSITTSTCDFTNEINHHAMFESYLSSENPWDAARRGEYAALKYISKFDDQAVWTMEDEEHRVPLYYACMSYSLQNNDSIYDQQQQQPPSSKLESVRLLVQTWPRERNFPKYLMDELPTIHADIRAILTRAEKKRRDVNNRGVVTRYQQQHQLSSSSPLHLMKNRSTINFPPTINERYSNKRMVRLISTSEAALAGAAVGSVSAASETLDVAPLIIDDVDQVVPMSFLEDLGDDGYVEDY